MIEKIATIKEKGGIELNDVDALSLPVSKQETDLAILFEIPERKSSEKPGRILQMIWDKRFPLVKGMAGAYVYTVTITSGGARPGNHYHKKRKEIYFVLSGIVEVFLENIATRKQQRCSLGDKPQALYIKPGVAHVVVPHTEHSILLVVADSPNSDGDEFGYEISKQTLTDTA